MTKNKFYMREYLLYLLLLFSLLSFNCKNQSIPGKSVDFENYVKKIPKVDLPFHTTCKSCCHTKKLDIGTALLKKYNPDNLEIIGKLVETDKYVAILYAGGGDYLSPGLIVYNRNGEKLSEQSFMGDQCGRVVDFYGYYCLDIDTHLQIKETDTTLVFKMDTVSFKIIDTLKKEINLIKYEINEKGEIIKK